MQETIFTKIIKREIPANIVYEDDVCIAILDISQVTKGHTLVIPKQVYRNIFDIPEDVLTHLIKIVKRITTSMKIGLKIEGVNLINNSGQIAHQTVDHFHIHILPRYNKEEYSYKHANNLGKTSKEEFNKLQNIIKSNL